MSWEPRLAFAHNLVRHAASTIDPNDAQRLIDRVERWGWDDWCRLWLEEAARHETLAKEAAAEKGRAVNAAEAWRARDDAILDHKAEREGATEI